MDPLDIPEEGDVEEFAELNVPDIASKDPAERKLARTIRIQKRVEALSRLERLKEIREEGEEEEKQPEKPTLLQIQLEKSSEVLKQLFLECEEQVTNIRVANDARAADRREYEQINREQILEKLEEEAELAKKMFLEIALRWEGAMHYNDPLNINDMIQSQKIKFDELCKQKDEVISMLKMEVRMAETKFNNDQRKQNDDITTLAKRVEKQVATMRAAHRIELQAIEDVMIQDRQNLCENNDKRWDDLYRKREEQELSISDHKTGQKDSFEAVVTHVRTMHMERVREVKIRLEKDYGTLQREFELIKATAMANREKMDYNYQILRKREGENIIIKSNQKRRLNKLRDFINVFSKRISEYTKKTDAAIKKLCEEILALQKYISGVRAKSLSLSATNERRYMEVWALNSSVAEGVLNKLVTIDKLLHEQQLGLMWEEPTVKLLKKKELPSYIDGYNILHSMKDKSLQAKSSFTVESGNVDSLSYRRALYSVLERISDRSGFLIEYRLRKILDPLGKSEGDLIKIDNVFSGLGITKDEDINTMLQFFKPYIRCPICTSLRRRNVDAQLHMSSSEKTSATTIQSVVAVEPEANALYAVHEADYVINEIVYNMVEPKRFENVEPIILKQGECLGPPKRDIESEKLLMDMELEGNLTPSADRQCQVNHPIYIEPCFVLKAVKEFVASNFCASDERQRLSYAVLSVKKTMNLSRLMSKDDVRMYWERFKLVLGPNKMGLWDALWYSLQKYHRILEDRHKMNEKLKCIRIQNNELKHLLSSYKAELQQKAPCAQQREIPIHSMPKVIECKSKKI